VGARGLTFQNSLIPHVSQPRFKEQCSQHSYKIDVSAAASPLDFFRESVRIDESEGVAYQLLVCPPQAVPL